MNHPTNDDEANKKSEALPSYTSHNYDAINHAIDTEVDKRHQLIEFYRTERSSNIANTFVSLAIGLSVIAVAAAVVWWLLHQPAGQIIYGPTEDRESIIALNTISNNESVDAVQQGFIDTSFTVFHRTLISSGEFVVTGKTYSPEDLTQPEDQYCYLEKAQSDTGLSGVPLASFEDNRLALETDNLDLAKLAQKYCQFSQRAG